MPLQFALSGQLVAKILEYQAKLQGHGKHKITEDSIASAKDEGGRMVLSHLMSCAQTARYDPTLQFQILKGGKFLPEIDEELGGMFCLPPGEPGDSYMQAIATEFLTWVTEHASELEENPRGPILRYVVDGEDVTGHVKPPEPVEHDPNFVRATEVG